MKSKTESARLNRKNHMENQSVIENTIADKLAEIEEKEQVRILYAVESGSRSWGVASPDSDYDVRFVYVRQKEDYLRLQKIRDVIEWQLDEVLDISGWDLKKTLVQFHRGNATLFEWANSPIVYKTTEEWEKLYALRPLLACSYIEANHSIPPVRFEELLEKAEGFTGSAELASEIQEMLRLKALDGEKQVRPQLPALQRYIEEEIARYEQLVKTMAEDRNPDWELLNRQFLNLLDASY